MPKLKKSTKLLIAECSLSLAEAIQDAGGGIESKGMLNITLGEFIADVAAQNYIRFVHDPPKKKRRDKELEELHDLMNQEYSESD